MKDKYLPKMMAGEWQGTMALTEPQAGSSLTDITLTGNRRIRAITKSRARRSSSPPANMTAWITSSTWPSAESRARRRASRAFPCSSSPRSASRRRRAGIQRCQLRGHLSQARLSGRPITQLAFGENDDCRGWLVGEANKGLGYMFQMMNGARIDVGLGAACIASAAYYASLEYAKERPQGRKLTSKDPLAPQVPIIEHADIKRMLLFQKAIVEGSLSLLMQCGLYQDLEQVTEGEEHENYNLLLELLTPVAKTYPSEMGILSCSPACRSSAVTAICDEFPLEQFYRDVRIHPIHEGTTGIQGMDLLGRKMTMKKGKAAQLYLAEVRKAIQAARNDAELKPYAAELESRSGQAGKSHRSSVRHCRTKGPEMFLADATLYLEFFGIIAIAWQWLIQATVAKKALATKSGGSRHRISIREKFITCRLFLRLRTAQDRRSGRASHPQRRRHRQNAGAIFRRINTLKKIKARSCRCRGANYGSFRNRACARSTSGSQAQAYQVNVKRRQGDDKNVYLKRISSGEKQKGMGRAASGHAL